MARKPDSRPNRLTAKDFKFVQLIIEGVKPEQAAIQCGHKATGARTAGFRLLEKPAIKAYLESERLRRLDQLRKETEVDDIWVTKKFKEILQRCMQPEPVMSFNHESGMLEQVVDEDTGQLLFKFDAMGAIKAAENLAKHIGYYEIDNAQRQPVINVGIVVSNQISYEQPQAIENPTEDTTYVEQQSTTTGSTG